MENYQNHIFQTTSWSFGWFIPDFRLLWLPFAIKWKNDLMPIQISIYLKHTSRCLHQLPANQLSPVSANLNILCHFCRNISQFSRLWFILFWKNTSITKVYLKKTLRTSIIKASKEIYLVGHIGFALNKRHLCPVIKVERIFNAVTSKKKLSWDGLAIFVPHIIHIYSVV